MVLAGGIVPVNSSRVEIEADTEIFLLNNGYHVVLVLPLEGCPFTEILDTGIPVSDGELYYYFGWGDRSFYLGTPTVTDIDWPLALRAVLLPTRSVLEVAVIRRPYTSRSGVVSIRVSSRELVSLYQYVYKSISLADGIPDVVSEDEVDTSFAGSVFFEAEGTYSLFFTCNNWTNTALKQAGITTHLWTPLAWRIGK